jgi:hypothetical protein
MGEVRKPVSEKERKARIRAAGERAKAEAEARRKAVDAARAAMPKEPGGSAGPEPTRYGDWEHKGIASDF